MTQAHRRPEDGGGDRLRVRARRGADDLRPGRRACDRVAHRARPATCSTSSGGSRSGRSCSAGCSSRSRRCSTSARTSSSAKWEFLTPGSLVAALLWIAASGLFAVYTATFASYNKTWGTLSAVIVMLTWLWITAMALLLGAEINARGRAEPRAARLEAPKAQRVRDDEDTRERHRTAGDQRIEIAGGQRAATPRRCTRTPRRGCP